MRPCRVAEIWTTFTFTIHTRRFSISLSKNNLLRCLQKCLGLKVKLNSFQKKIQLFHGWKLLMPFSSLWPVWCAIDMMKNILWPGIERLENSKEKLERIFNVTHVRAETDEGKKDAIRRFCRLMCHRLLPLLHLDREVSRLEAHEMGSIYGKYSV